MIQLVALNSKKTSIPIHQIIVTSMIKRGEKSLYYNYNEKFHHDHVCKVKIFVLLQVED